MRNDMTTGKEWKLILFFTLPIMAGSFLQQLYNTVDGIIVGQFVSEAAFSGVATCAALTQLFLALAMGLSIGVGIVISQYYGAGKHDRLPIAVDTALILLGTIGLILTAVGIMIAPFMLGTVLGVPAHILPYSVNYFRVYVLGLFFQFVYNGIAATLRGLGDSKAILFFLLISTVLNVILDLLFVAVLRFGVSGAAYATVVSQIVCVFVSYRYIRKRFPYNKDSKHWDKEVSATMAKLGLPIAIQQGVVSFGHGAMQRLVNSFSAAMPGNIAAYGAAGRLNSFITVPIMGFQSGLASFTGQNIGAGRLDRVYRGFRRTLAMSMSVTLVMCFFMNFNAERVVSAFGVSGNALALGAEQIRFMTWCYWMFCCYQTMGGLLQGSGDTAFQSITTLSALGSSIVAAYALVYFNVLGYSAAWSGTPIGWALAITISYTRFFTGGWRKKAVAGSLARGAPQGDAGE